jgi:colanic acid/amylovoran biosynthesis glycosyltransferase
MTVHRTRDPAALPQKGDLSPRRAPLKVAFRVGAYPSISETFVQSQIDGMIARGCSAEVLADVRGAGADEGGRPAPGGDAPRVRTIAPAQDRLTRLWSRLPYRFRRAATARAERAACRRADAVICNFGWFGASVADAVRGRDRRAALAVIFHGDDMSRALKGASDDAYRTVFAEADLLLPISRFWRRRLIEMGAPPERIAVHRMGVDTDRLAFAPRPLGGEGLRVLTVGRLVEKKGTEYLLRAMHMLARTAPGSEAKLVIVGDGPLRPELEALATRLGLSDRVAFRGALPHSAISAELARADVFALPSVVAADGDMEGIPVSIMEAMASGVPVVATRHSGIPELVEDGRSGLLVDERDPQGLADQLARLARDPELRRTCARHARRAVETEFDNRRANDALLAMLHDAVARRAGAPGAAPVLPKPATP